MFSDGVEIKRRKVDALGSDAKRLALINGFSVNVRKLYNQSQGFLIPTLVFNIIQKIKLTCFRVDAKLDKTAAHYLTAKIKGTRFVIGRRFLSK